MNPDVAIRTWLLAAGKQYGTHQAHYRRWPDYDTRAEQQYFTYRFVRMIPAETGIQNQSVASGYDKVQSHWQQWKATVQIDYYNSEDGIYELAAISLAAKSTPSIRSVFQSTACAFIETLDVSEQSTHDDELINHHQRMLCDFYVNVEFELTESNAVVDEINFNMQWTGAEENAFVLGSETELVASGSMTMVIA